MSLGRWGQHNRGSVYASQPAPLGSILGIPKNFSEKLFLKKFVLDVAEIKHRHSECGKLEYVDRIIKY